MATVINRMKAISTAKITTVPTLLSIKTKLRFNLCVLCVTRKDAYRFYM